MSQEDNQGGIELKDATSTSSLKTQNGSLQLIADSFNDVASSSIVFRLDALNSGEIATLNSTGLNIGSGSPTHKLTVAGTTSHETARVLTTTGNANLRVSTDNSDFSIIGQGGSNRLDVWDNNASATRLSLDANGNLLVGTTDDFPPSDSGNEGVAIKPDNIAISRNNSTALLFLDRMSSDGNIIDFRKDNTTVGTIGTNSGYIRIGTGDTHLLYHSGIDTIIPYSGSANRDNAISLGYSGARFKDLHLSGNANIGTNLTVQGTLSAGTIAPDSVNTDTLNTESIIFDSSSTNIATQNARTTTTSSTSQTAIISMGLFTSVKFQVQITDSTTSSFHVTEIMVLNDGTNQYISEYGTITTGSALATFDADKTATNLRLLATPTTSNTLEYKIIYQAIYS